MAKKSKAQIKRLMERAAARGEAYVPPAEEETTNEQEDAEQTEGKEEAPTKDSAGGGDNKKTKKKEQVSQLDEKDQLKMKTAIQLKKELDAIANDADLKAKERRSAKRKAEAIATEACGMESEELLTWYHKQSGPDTKDKKPENEKDKNRAEQAKPIPYVLFVGQLSYDTTKKELFEHIKSQLGDEHKVTDKTVHIRLLTDTKTKKSRGMAFVQVQDPEMMYACLKMHHTMLGGRRINVEKSAGGSKHSETRKTKLQSHRREQEEHVETALKSMLEEYYKSGEIKEGELDDVAMLVSKRHSAGLVQATLERYVDSSGRDMDNPSAYFTFLLGKLAEEGIFVTEGREKESQPNDKQGRTNSKRPNPSSSKPSPQKRPKKHTRDPSLLSKSSDFAKQGVDMSSSRAKSGEPDLLKIFPSMGRGRGRGRGYL